MLTSRNNDLRWILATIVESGNRRFWGWHKLCFVTFFWLLFFLCTWNQFFSPVQPLLLCCLLLLHHPVSTFVGPRHCAIVGAFVAVHRPLVAFAEGVGCGWCARVLYNFIIWLRKKLITVNSFTTSSAHMCQLIKSFVIA
jgi:hypothetical protein